MPSSAVLIHPDVHDGFSPAEAVEVGEAYLIAR